jgi:outer membrane receptor protein involved in Fe transport
LEPASGVLVQETTPGQASPFLRGLTGYQTLLVVDDIRLNTSMFRSGPNQYLGFLEPGQIETVEAVLGPSSAAFGSDALGGTVQLRTRSARPGPPGAAWTHGDAGMSGASGDWSVRVDATVSTGWGSARWGRVWLLGSGSGRRHNDARTGGALDSHHVYTRFFGLPARGRLQDTGFRQYGTLLKGGWRSESGHDLTASYQRGAMRDVRAYRELQGGLGRLQALYQPQSLDLLYGRWERYGWGVLESLRATVSYNRQVDDSQRQGPLYSDVITRDWNRAEATGGTLQGTATPWRALQIGFGADLYRERIASARTEENPATGQPAVKRAQYPDGSLYRSGGFYAQARWQSAGGRWQAGAEGRWTDVAVTLGPAAGAPGGGQRFQNATWNANLRWRAHPALAFGALAGRGFRAPNLNDLGTLGLTGLGFEVPAAEAVSAGAQFGADASEGALPVGRAPRPLRAESMLNYELSARLTLGRFSWRAQGFTFDLHDPIVRRTMLFPLAAPPTAVAGMAVQPVAPTAAQRTAGVTGVATALDARAIKAFVNDGSSRYAGVETDLRWALTRRWSVEASSTWITGRERSPDRPARRLPPRMSGASLRYAGAPRRPWFELGLSAHGEQARLNPGDVDDERIGASRRRADIAAFFRAGMNAASVSPGADGRPGTADDVFAPTGETLRQMQDRVLPLGTVVQGVLVVNDQSRAPLFTRSPGWWTARVRAGMPVGERWDLFGGVENMLDRDYRVHGSGIDGMGRSVFAGIRFRF